MLKKKSLKKLQLQRETLNHLDPGKSGQGPVGWVCTDEGTTCDACPPCTVHVTTC